MSTLGTGTLGSGTLGTPTVPSYVAPAFTDAGGSISLLYAPPAYTDAGGDLIVLDATPLTVGGVSALDQYVLLVDLYFNGGYARARVSGTWWYSRSTDSIGVCQWEGRIISEPTFGIRVGCVAWGSKTSISIGSIEVADPAAELNWTALVYRDMLCELRLVQLNGSYDSARLVGRAIIDSVERHGTSIVVQLRGYDTLLDKPLQTTVFEAASPSDYVYDSVGIWDSNTLGSIIGAYPEMPDTNNFTTSGSLVGVSVPVVVGKVYQYEPQLTDPQHLGFRVTDVGVVVLNEVMSGGSVAIPPTLVTDPDWDYVWAKSGFVMNVMPSARVTVNCDGIAALDVAVISDNFISDTPWSSAGLLAWSVTSDTGLGLSHSEFGARCQSIVTLQRDTGLAENTWVVVLVDVPDMRGGYLELSLDRSYTIRRSGKHSFIAAVTSTSMLTVTAHEENGACEITIASIFVYPQTTTTASSLTEMARHIIVARGAIPDSGATWLPSSVGGSDPFDLLSSWTFSGSGVSSAVTNSNARIEMSAGDLIGTFSIAQLTSINSLVAGVRYTLTMTFNIVSLGGFGYVVVRTPTTDLLTPTTLGVQTLTVTFTPTTSTPLYIFCGQFSVGVANVEIYNISLTELEFDVSGAGVDFPSLSEIDDGYDYGLVADGPITVREALSNLTDSISAWFYPDNEGKIRFGQLDDVSGESAVTLSDVNMLAPPNYIPDLAPGLSDTLAGARNWSPYADAELAGITFPNRPPFKAEYRARRVGAYSTRLASPYTHAIGAESIKTLLYYEADVQTEINRLTNLYRFGRGFWEVEIALESALAAVLLRPDLAADLDSRFFASDDGTTRMIVGVEGRYGSNVVKLFIWGGDGA